MRRRLDAGGSPARPPPEARDCGPLARMSGPVPLPCWEAAVGPDADEFVRVDTPPYFLAIDQFCTDFSQTTDEEVVACLQGAAALTGAGLGTLLVDLLTPRRKLPAPTCSTLHCMPAVLPSDRLAARTAGRRAGSHRLFGASTGAAAALQAAAEPGADIGAIVSRGGRPKLARARLAAVAAPTLLAGSWARK